MTAELSIFRFDGADVRTVVIDGEPWFVGNDVARVLGYANAADALRRHTRGVAKRYPLHTAGGVQEFRVLSEPDVLRLIIGSNLPEAERFERWVFEEVLPAVRRTGEYVAPVQESPEQLMARALVTAQGVIERKDQQIAVLTPRAEAWDDLASAEGDFKVADAAKILARAGVATGQNRLFDQLAAIKWIHRGSQGKWEAYQSAVNDGYLTERPQSHHHPRTGELVLDPPQVRVTIRGLERLRIRLGVLTAVEVAS